MERYYNSAAIMIDQSEYSPVSTTIYLDFFSTSIVLRNTVVCNSDSSNKSIAPYSIYIAVVPLQYHSPQRSLLQPIPGR